MVPIKSHGAFVCAEIAKINKLNQKSISPK
jgi:hypothetical protein